MKDINLKQGLTQKDLEDMLEEETIDEKEINEFYNKKENINFDNYKEYFINNED